MPRSDYPDFLTSTGYGNILGLGGVNCRHSFGAYVEGITPETYSEDYLDKLNSETVKYNGEDVPFYEATQISRHNERQIREWKRRTAIKEASGQDATAENMKVKQWQARQRDFIKQTGMSRQYIRERIGE